MNPRRLRSEPGVARGMLAMRHNRGGPTASRVHLDTSPGQRPGSLRAWLVGQFGHPRGVGGRLAGWIMAHRPSNRQRNAWTVDLLGGQPGWRVLEIGFGPGLSLHRLASRVGPTGLVTGIDVSAAMLGQAQRRNRAAVASGRMDLRVASVADLPDSGEAFDAVLTVNSVGFWPDRLVQFRKILGRLVPGGRFAVTLQPRTKGATAETTARMQGEIEAGLRDAGFVDVTSHTLDLEPPAVCVVGQRDRAFSATRRRADRVA